jgi:hypothetical protein
MKTVLKMSDATVTIYGIAVADREGLERGFDGRVDTKFWVYQSATWIQFDYKAAKTVKSYAITIATDKPTRDPKDWTLQGSNDGKTWQNLDQRSDEVFNERKKRHVFTVKKPTAYKHYRLDITKNGGDKMIHFAELELLEEAK